MNSASTVMNSSLAVMNSASPVMNFMSTPCGARVLPARSRRTSGPATGQVTGRVTPDHCGPEARAPGMMRAVLRTVWAAFVAVFVTIPTASAVLVVAAFKSNSSVVDAMIRLWARVIVWGAGIDLGIENVDAMDRNQRYVLVANHYSYFDIPCILAAIPQPIRFMAKVSLFKIPIFGWSLGRAGFIPIDRKNRRTAVKSFDLAVERIRKGNTIVIFPEEGRSREVAMRPFQPGVVTIRVGTEIETAGVSVRAKDTLLEQSRGQIEEMLAPEP